MKVLIFENEKPAQDRLIQLIKEYDTDIDILGVVESVAMGIEWFKKHQNPDLILMDIQLDDGICFELFEYVNITVPIIFTTAFDEYAIKAFKLNSVDYLLKPLSANELAQALNKFKNVHFFNKESNRNINIQELIEVISKDTESFKERFLIKVMEHYKSILTHDIAYFFIVGNAVFLHDNNNREYAVDFTISQLEKKLNPKDFFRINRKYLINIKFIKDILIYSNNRLKLILIVESQDDMIISRERINEFKKWMD